jgi:hypothetical protein
VYAPTLRIIGGDGKDEITNNSDMSVNFMMTAKKQKLKEM